MKALHLELKELRERKELKLSQLVAQSGIDQGLLSKYEHGVRDPSEKHIDILAKIYEDNQGELKKLWLAEKVAKLIYYHPEHLEILSVAESRVEYLVKSHSIELPEIPEIIQPKIEEITELKNKWNDQKPLNRTQLAKLKDYFKLENTYESNKIEGNTLTLQETHLVINEGITIGGKSMREHLEAINHNEAIDFIEDLVNGKEDFNKRTLLEIHRLILKSIDNENAGKYRNVPVRISGSKHEPPQPYLLEKLMEDYFVQYELQKKRVHPVLLAAEMHERLVSIHPFIDGNGRTSRLVMNFILLKHGYTVTSLKGDLNSRISYYKALEEVQMNNSTMPFYELILNEVKQSLSAHLELI